MLPPSPLPLALPEISISEVKLGQQELQRQLGNRDSIQSKGATSIGSTGRSVSDPPSPKKARNLVICLDGTLNTVGESPTNVLQTFSLSAEDPLVQIRHYQTGIGINLKSWQSSNPLATIKRVVDSAVAYRLGEHVCEAYRFLVKVRLAFFAFPFIEYLILTLNVLICANDHQNYQAGDKIFVFGFSRGAYAARCLAGMIEQVGLLSQGNETSISLAYEVYKRSNTPGAELPGGLTLPQYFSQNFARSVQIDFLGVWDTVSSIGAVIPRDLPFSTSSSAILHFRQCVALDERRCLYAYHPHHGSSDNSHPHNKTVKEVFFVGAHSDVGGGSFPARNGKTAQLSNLSLKWMLKEALEHGLKLSPVVDSDPRFTPFRLDATSALADRQSPVSRYVSSIIPKIDLKSPDAFALAVLYLANAPFSPTAVNDALAPRSDALSFRIQHNNSAPASNSARVGLWVDRLGQRVETVGWRMLEYLPIAKRKWSPAESKFKLTFRPGFASPRRIPVDAELHPSVLIRRTTPIDRFSSQGNNKNVPETSPYVPKAKSKEQGEAKGKESETDSPKSA